MHTSQKPHSCFSSYKITDFGVSHIFQKGHQEVRILVPQSSFTPPVRDFYIS